MTTRRSFLLTAGATLLPGSLFAQSDAPPTTVSADRDALRTGVNRLVAPGSLPGQLAVFGPNAFAVLEGQGDGTPGVLVAAARWGRGRVVVLSHESFLSAANRNQPDNQRLFTNILTWFGNGKASATPPRIADASALAAALEARQNKAKKAPLQFVGTSDTIFCALLDQDDLSGTRADLIPALQAWVSGEGGNLIIAGPAWGWKQTHSGKVLSRDHTGNRLLAPVGIGFADGTLPANQNDAWAVGATDDLDALHAQAALRLLDGFASGRVRLKDGALGRATRTVSAALDVMPDTAPFARDVARLTARAGGAVLPTPTMPVTDNQPFARLAILRQVRQMETAPETMKALSCADAFPGAVSADAKRVSASVPVDTNVLGWHSTGLYAAPGSVVTVTIPDALAGQGLGVRIGVHTDSLTHLSKWQRFPVASVHRDLAKSVTQFANPLGGTIVIDVPESARPQVVNVQISGAVASPLFVRGKTTPEQWRQSRTTPGPWAEIVGTRCALSVPSSVVRTLEDLEALMAHWDAVCDACADLYAIPRQRKRPERYATDVQISAGYMHSGYPIMTGLDVAERFVDLKTLTGDNGDKNWGFYHEIGHNHQQPAWTWDGCGEVTNNLFSLYGGEVFSHIYQNGDYVNTHSAIRPEERQKRFAEYEAAGKPYEKWKNDPFLALGMFIELRQRFGWEPFKKVFAEYEALPRDRQPRTDLEKRDQFMTRFSRTVGKNLAPHFVRWGIPTSDAARAALSDLPA